MLVYCIALVFYLWVRITKTLDLGRYLPYGIFVLIVEIMGATTTLLYGVNILWHPVNPPLPEDPNNPGLPKACFAASFVCPHAAEPHVRLGHVQCVHI